MSTELEMAVLAWAGDIDIAVIPPLLAQIDVVMRDPAVTSVVIDLGAVTFLESIGVGTLLDARRRALADDVAFAIRNASPRLMRLVEMCGVTQVLGLSQ